MSSVVASTQLEPARLPMAQGPWAGARAAEPEAAEPTLPAPAPAVDEDPPTGQTAPSSEGCAVSGGADEVGVDLEGSQVPDDNADADHVSDSDYVVGSEDAGTSPSEQSYESESVDSDSSSTFSSEYEAKQYRTGKRRPPKRPSKRKRGKKRLRRERPENEMTRKLRSRAPERPDDSSGNFTEVHADLVDSEDATPVLGREVGKEDAELQVQAIRTMWEMAAILEFLDVFKPQLGIGVSYSADALEEALVKSPGPGLLADLHMALLRGISPRMQLSEFNWTAQLALKLHDQWRREQGVSDLPFRPMKGQESEDYAKLPSVVRVHALKSLCDIRAEREDIRITIDEVLRPRKVKSQAKGVRNNQATVTSCSINDVRKEPIGRDSMGCHYWYLDLLNTSDVRLYKEEQPRNSEIVPVDVKEKMVKKQGGGRHRAKGSQAAPPACGDWLVVAGSVSDLEGEGKRLGSSNKRADKALARKLLDEIVPGLHERHEAEERRRKAAAKVQMSLGNIILDGNGGYGRSLRTRKPVDNTFTDYNNMLDHAIRQGRQVKPDNHQFSGRTDRGVGQESVAEHDLEALKRGQQRGRSALAAIGTYTDVSDNPSPKHRADGENGTDESGDNDIHGPSDESIPRSGSATSLVDLDSSNSGRLANADLDEMEDDLETDCGAGTSLARSKRTLLDSDESEEGQHRRKRLCSRQPAPEYDSDADAHNTSEDGEQLPVPGGQIDADDYVPSEQESEEGPTSEASSEEPLEQESEELKEDAFLDDEDYGSSGD
ncbi:unnamed protein product [Ostreobium quekettii]|uniref:DDT domain-containing protein n=1 Tax=Ostreobium quekettii TaxID=121088 RepID=A0A8S1J4R9_9CHLO|nr:unnamed protein product [Ostreobium quekettii]|eukprot:evm.model.scf_779.6 EVM.evm.TU.scf_779.6   scf_779:44313-51077(-)